MSNFKEVMATNPPRLVVLFRRGPDGSEQFQWGVVGSIPVLSLIGCISEVQSDLATGEWIPGCDDGEQMALVITWDAETRDASWYMHSDIPSLPLSGMLESIKAMLVDSRLAQQAAANRTQLLGPDGTPMRF